MAISGYLQITGTVAGVPVSCVYNRTAAAGLPAQDVTLAAGNAGTLSTRTSDTAGTLTLESGHDISTGDVIDVHWTDADGDPQCAYGATVGTVDVLSVPFTGAAGTALPVQDFVIVADEVQVLDVDFDGDKLQMIVAVSTQVGHIVFEDSGDAVLDNAVLRAAKEPYFFVKNAGMTNELAGNPVDEIHISNGHATETARFQLVGTYDSDT